MRILIFVIIGLVQLEFSAEAAKRQGPNAESPEVQVILDEIEDLIRRSFSLPEENNDYSTEELSQEDDIIYTRVQAMNMLVKLKQEMGIANSNDRIVKDLKNLWNFPILYSFNEEQYDENMKANVRAGIKLWAESTCLEFEERSQSQMGPNDAYMFMNGSGGCASMVGRQRERGPQEVWLGKSCDTPALVAHEIGHALGLFHEQNRPDRDEHISIYWDNILGGIAESSFNIDPNDVDPAGTPFDLSSVMMYSSTSLSKDKSNRLRTVMPNDVMKLGAMGQRFELSFNDVKRINHGYHCAEYKCNKAQLSVADCLNGGYQDPNNCAVCRCPTGTSGADCAKVELSKGQGLESCGGDVLLNPCEIRTLALPTFPNLYSPDSTCTWRINTAASGLVFTFQSPPDMFCDISDVCYDYIEIRAGRLDAPGRRFCKCSLSKGRVVSVDNPKDVLVRFVARTSGDELHAPTAGPLLNVYSTCNGTLASQLSTSCRISSTNYDTCSNLALPLCPVETTAFIEPPK